MTVHEKVKNHFCEHCDYAAFREDAMKNHLLKVHKLGDRKFTCDQCPFVSYYEAQLKFHVKTVHDKVKNNVNVIRDSL